MEDYDAIYKVVIVGDPGTGKSSLINRFVDDQYSEEYLATIGVDFKIKTIDLGCKRIKLQIWDTAGQERFRSIVSSYYRRMNAALVVFDVNNGETFHNVSHWMSELKLKGSQLSTSKLPTATPPTPLTAPSVTFSTPASVTFGTGAAEPEYILIGAKSDLDRIVSQDDISDMEKRHNMKYFTCSAKKGTGIEPIFTYLAETLYAKIGKVQLHAQSRTIPTTPNQRLRSRFCC